MSSLQDYFRAQVRWRREKAEEYPDDERNAQSAAALESLAEYVNSEADGVIVAELKKHQFEGRSLGGAETGRAVSRYGYGYPVNSMSHEAFLEELLVLCFKDAYAYASEQEGFDPTETLYPFEIAAACRDVSLPSGYFERRAKGGSTESQLQAWVDELVLEEAPDTIPPSWEEDR